MTTEDLLLREFRTHYLADELPASLLPTIPAMARASAIRLRQQLDGRPVAPMVRLLREMSADLTHRQVRAVEDETSIPWTEDPGDWEELRLLLAGIANALDDGGSTAAR